MGEAYSRAQPKGGGDVLTVARRLRREVDGRLAERRAGVEGVGSTDELLSISREVATVETRPWEEDPAGGRRTLGCRRLVREWPSDDPVRTMVLELNELLQRPLP